MTRAGATTSCAEPGGQPDHLYRDVSEELAEAGMVSFRYDKRGTGQSPLPAGERLAFEDLAGDARAGVDLLAERSEVDPEALAVVGHDEGALLAMRLAASDPRVRTLVLISAPGRPLVDVIADDFRATHGEASAGTLREIVAGLMATGGLPRPDSLPPEHRDFFPADQAPYLREIFSVDPAADAGAVRVPALVVHGGRATFSTAVDAARLVEALGPHGEAVVAADAGPTLARTRA
ncbi:MAG: lysophospholipase, partial [Actinomycetota bacterium]|nr:lysophospholipase [Actinomycetota bacterium]